MVKCQCQQNHADINVAVSNTRAVIIIKSERERLPIVVNYNL